MTDWSIGSYERTAAALDAVSERVVTDAGVARGERVLDIACGTGNAALRAAALGAEVTGVDLAERLVLVAGERARAAGLAARFLTGDAQALPVEDGCVDVALSVFGLIFAPDQERAAAELVRVLAPGGRALVTAWVGTGALAEIGAATARAQAPGSSAPGPAARSPVGWSDPDHVRALFAGHPVDVGIAEATVAFAAASPEAWVREQAEHHPVWLGVRERLGDERFGVLAQEMTDILHEHNEDPAGLRVTSRYTIITLTRR